MIIIIITVTVYLCLIFSVRLFVHLFVCLPHRPSSVTLFFCVSMCLSVCLSVCLSSGDEFWLLHLYGIWRCDLFLAGGRDERPDKLLVYWSTEGCSSDLTLEEPPVMSATTHVRTDTRLSNGWSSFLLISRWLRLSFLVADLEEVANVPVFSDRDGAYIIVNSVKVNLSEIFWYGLHTLECWQVNSVT